MAGSYVLFLSGPLCQRVWLFCTTAGATGKHKRWAAQENNISARLKFTVQICLKTTYDLPEKPCSHPKVQQLLGY